MPNAKPVLSGGRNGEQQGWEKTNTLAIPKTKRSKYSDDRPMTTRQRCRLGHVFVGMRLRQVSLPPPGGTCGASDHGYHARSLEGQFGAFHTHGPRHKRDEPPLVKR